MPKEVKQWITVNGQHIPIYEGESKDDAVKRAIGKSQINIKKNDDQKTKDIKRNETEKEIVNKQHEEKPAKLDLKDSTDYDEFKKQNMSQLKAYLKNNHATMADIEQEWYQTRHDAELKDLHEIDPDKFSDSIHIKDSHLEGWFRNADSDYKPRIAEGIFNNHETLNAGMNIAYYNYRYEFERYSKIYEKWVPHDGVDQSKKLSFKEWLNTPQTLYRGHKGQKTIASDVFMSYSPDRKVAEKFAGKDGQIESIQIKPIDTWGSYKTTGELEYLVPIKWLNAQKKK